LPRPRHSGREAFEPSEQSIMARPRVAVLPVTPGAAGPAYLVRALGVTSLVWPMG